MKRRTVARVISVVLLAYLLGIGLVSIDIRDMAHFRSLTHEALLSELAEDHKGNFDGNFGISLFLIGGIVVLVDGLAWVVELAINRISPGASASNIDRPIF